MPRKWKAIATLGDISPVDDGGGVVFKHGRNEYVLVYNRHGLADLPDEMLQGEDGEDTELEVLFLELPKTYDEFRVAYNDAPWDAPYGGAIGCCDMSPQEFSSQLRELRFAKGDDFVKKSVYLIEMLISYGGYDLAGGNVNEIPAHQLEKLFEKGVF